ncbi:MAG TPA: Cj0069 family protein, partial [Fimbriimonadaceae bacterium]|nr:Cj0069 family protein [Fimbriimonadaceae bacterium]
AAVQVWVNPIMDDGHNRSKLDALLREVAAAGVLVSSHPDTIQKIGTKTVLYETRHMGWGSDIDLYRSSEEMRARLPERLRAGKPRVLKQHRGHSGHGVWKLTPKGDRVVARHAARGSEDREMSLEEWAEVCAPYFAEGPMLDQAYNERIGEGTIRCYLVRGRVEGFGHQEVNALVPGSDPGPRLYFPPDRADFQALKRRVEDEWVPELMATTGLAEEGLPMLWDLDFMLGPGEGAYMLCEINVSSVYPYPESAMRPLAEAIRARLAAPDTAR